MADSVGVNYPEMRAAIKTEKERRIREHQTYIATRSRMTTAMGAGAQGALNLICQGDSWFDYPLPVPVVNQSDVVAHLKHLPSMSPEVLSLAHYGEAAEDMLGVTKLHEFLAQLEDPANGKFDAILFSGGGNDLAGNQFRLWLADAAASGMDPTKGLNPQRVTSILGVVAAGYQDLFIARDGIDKTIPIFAHSYDFAIPSGIGVCDLGPWLKPGLDDRGWTDLGMARSIVKQLLLEFDAMLEAFATVAGNNFVHVKTQGTLADAQWANELHPNPDGFAAIAGKFVDALRSSFPGRI